MKTETDIHLALQKLEKYARYLDGKNYEDLIQDTGLRALENQHLYVAKKDICNWLFTIMRRIFLDQIKQSNAIKRKNDRSDFNDIQNLEYKVESRISIDRRNLKDVILKSNRVGMDCIFLYAFFGLRYEEISKMLNIKLNTVKSRINQFREYMNKNYKKEDFIKT